MPIDSECLDDDGYAEPATVGMRREPTSLLNSNRLLGGTTLSDDFDLLSVFGIAGTLKSEDFFFSNIISSGSFLTTSDYLLADYALLLLLDFTDDEDLPEPSFFKAGSLDFDAGFFGVFASG